MKDRQYPEETPAEEQAEIHKGDNGPGAMASYPQFAEMTREVQDLYKILAEAAHDMIFIIGRDGRVLYVNSFAARALGKPTSEVIGKMRSDLFPRKVSEAQEQNIRRVFDSKTTLYFEDLTVFQGKEIWLGTQLVPLKDENRNVYAIMGISRDITERKQAEDALRESEERFRAIFEQAAVGITQVDLDCRFVRVNQKFCDITGYRPDELIGRTFWDITYMPDIREEEALISGIFKGDIKTYAREKRYVRKDGSLIWVNLTAAVMYKNGKPQNLIGVTQDISKRKRAEEALRESEGRFCQMAESINEVFFMGSKDWSQAVYVSPAYENIFGRSLESLYADPTSWRDSIDGEDRERIEAMIEREAKGDFSETGTEFRIIRPDGTLRWISIRSYPVLNEKGDIYRVAGIAEDITEIKRNQESLRLAQFSIDKAADMAIWVAPDGSITYANEAACKAFGYTHEEFLTKKTFDTNPFFNKDNWGRHWKELKERFSFTFEASLRRKDGSRFPAEITANYLVYEGREYNCSYVRDITDRKRAEAELMRANRALKAISKCNEAMIHAEEEYALLEDICKIIVEVGGYRMAWIGYAENDSDRTVRVMAKTGYEEGYLEKSGIAWSDTEKGRGPTGTAIRTKKPYVVRNIHTDLNFLPWRAEALKRGYASTLGLPLIAEGQAFGALTIYSDRPDVFDRDEIVLLQELADNLAYGITSLRSQAKREQAERELKDAKAQSEMYLDLMGHDINNMNQIALGFLELALNTLKLDKGAVELISRPLEALESSTNLINNVRRLQHAKNGGLQSHMIEVGQVLDNVIPKFSNIVGREIMIRRNYECKCTVMANGLLDDVFSNIIGNAIKHSTGPLTIDVHVKKTTVNDREYCQISVEDDGPGIPDEIKGTLFARFQSGTPRSSGKGLGLFLIKTLVEDFHGKVWIENRVPGDYRKGCKFIVLLPVAD